MEDVLGFAPQVYKFYMIQETNFEFWDEFIKRKNDPAAFKSFSLFLAPNTKTERRNRYAERFISRYDAGTSCETV